MVTKWVTGAADMGGQTFSWVLFDFNQGNGMSNGGDQLGLCGVPRRVHHYFVTPTPLNMSTPVLHLLAHWDTI